MASTAAQRKAWNEAMRSAVGAASALPPGLQPNKQKRRSGRHKKDDRRKKARKVQNLLGGDAESQEIVAAAWMDVLEGISPSGPTETEEDDEYDELDELDGDNKKKKRGRGGGRGGGGVSKRAKKNAGVLPNRFKPRSVANMLLEEMNREDGIAKDWLQAEARDKSQKTMPASLKFCPVTGMEGIYTEPKTGIPYANLQALEQIQERPPPWMTLGGALSYHEAVKSIRDE